MGSSSSTKDAQSGNGEYDTALFETGYGLSTGWFWHEYGSLKKPVREDRAVLFQSKENYQRVSENFKSYYDEVNYMENPTFGEQIIVDSYDVNVLAIGDVFEVQGGLSSLIIEVAAPRVPCGYLDTKLGAKGASGMRIFAHHNLLGGVFARVLRGGKLRDGMKLVRTANPHPKWTLRNIFRALYTTETRRQYLMCAPNWNRSREELEELINLPQLGEFEWKVEARKLLYKMDGIPWRTVKPHLIDPQCYALHPLHARVKRYIADNSDTEPWQTLSKLQIFPSSQFVHVIVFFISIYVMNIFLYGIQ